MGKLPDRGRAVSAAPAVPSKPAVPPAGTGNQLLAEAPAQLTTTLAGLPTGQRLILTVRTPSATLAVFLGGADAKTRAAQLSGVASKMPVSGLVSGVV